MSRNAAFWILFLGWAVLMALSVILPARGDADAVGLGAGINRMTAFFKYQIAASLVALPLVLQAKRLRLRWMRWLARLPAFIALLLILTVIGLIIWADLSKPDDPAYVPPASATQPVSGDGG